jgi:hypothetical protein
MLDNLNYKYAERIAPINQVAVNLLSTIDWRKIKKELSSNFKDPVGSSEWWFSIDTKDNKSMFESNIDNLTIDPTNLSQNGAEYLHIDLTCGTTAALDRLRNLALDFPGVRYAGIHFLGPNTVIQKHTDSATYNLLFHVKVANNCFMEIDTTKFNFQNGQIFLFDGEIPHSAENLSSEDWIMFVLRIDKDYFNVSN